MRAVQITELKGPSEALELTDLPDPAEPSHLMTPGSGVVVEVHAAGVSFPEVLQTRGEYQVKPPLPFVPGSEVAGIVRAASDDTTPIVRAPRPFATWIEAVPTPPAAPCTSTVSPACSRPRSFSEK